jgi:hypothetical protein
LLFQGNEANRYQIEFDAIKTKTQGGKNPHLLERLTHFKSLKEKWLKAKEKTIADIKAKKTELEALVSG